MDCPICGSTDTLTRREDRELSLLGLEGVVARNLLVTRCNECNEESLSFPNHLMVIAAIRESICKLSRRLYGREFALLRQGLELTGQALSELLGVSNVTISRWENGDQQVNPLADATIRSLTLANLGKGKQMLDILRDRAQNGVDHVVIDMALFNGTTVSYQTSVQFHEETECAWVVENLDY